MSFAMLDRTITDTDRPFARTGMSTYALRGGRGASSEWLLGALGLKMLGDEME